MKTKFMSKVFSGDEKYQDEILGKIEEAKDNGVSKTEDGYLISDEGDGELTVVDKKNGEITKLIEGEETFSMEAVTKDSKSYCEVGEVIEGFGTVEYVAKDGAIIDGKFVSFDVLYPETKSQSAKNKTFASIEEVAASKAKEGKGYDIVVDKADAPVKELAMTDVVADENNAAKSDDAPKADKIAEAQAKVDGKANEVKVDKPVPAVEVVTSDAVVADENNAATKMQSEAIIDDGKTEEEFYVAGMKDGVETKNRTFGKDCISTMKTMSAEGYEDVKCYMIDESSEELEESINEEEMDVEPTDESIEELEGAPKSFSAKKVASTQKMISLDEFYLNNSPKAKN